MVIFYVFHPDFDHSGAAMVIFHVFDPDFVHGESRSQRFETVKGFIEHKKTGAVLTPVLPFTAPI